MDLLVISELYLLLVTIIWSRPAFLISLRSAHHHGLAWWPRLLFEWGCQPWAALLTSLGHYGPGPWWVRCLSCWLFYSSCLPVPQGAAGLCCFVMSCIKSWKPDPVKLYSTWSSCWIFWRRSKTFVLNGCFACLEIRLLLDVCIWIGKASLVSSVLESLNDRDLGILSQPMGHL